MGYGLKDSLFSESNAELVDYLNYTTYPNIREGLRVFKQFLISGHTNVSDYIIRERFKVPNKTSPQIIPIFEFVKSISLNNKLYYNSEISIIHNLFIPPQDCNDHFLNLYILKDLLNIFESKGPTNKYVLSNRLIENFVGIGYRAGIIVNALTNLIKNNFIDTDEQLSDVDWDSLPKDLNIGITSKGHYYYKELAIRFHYIDLCLQDTPIFDKESFEKLKSDFPTSDGNGKRSLSSRLDSVKNFIDYLKLQESKQANNIKTIYGLTTDHICSGIASDLKRIEKILE